MPDQQQSDGKPSATPVVGGFPEPDGDQPMSAAEFRMVREALGVSGEWLAARLGITDRTVRRWEHGSAPIPDGVRVELEGLEAVASGHVRDLVSRLEDARDVVLSIPEHDGEFPAGWWRAIAYRVSVEVQGLHVTYG